MQRDHAPNQWRQILARIERAVERGLDMRCQVGARGIGVLIGLEATFHPFMGFPSYKAIAELPLAERVARMRDPELRARMLTETSEKVAGDSTPIPPLVDFFLANLGMVAMRLFPMKALPDYEPTLMQSMAGEASRAGKPVLAHIYDALLEDDGKALLYFPVYNYTGMSLDAVREMLTHPRALMGLGDAGAHVGTVCDASIPTYLLSHWARDRANGQYYADTFAATSQTGGDFLFVKSFNEWVEGTEVPSRLVKFGGDLVRGFHGGKPAPAAEMTAWLRRRRPGAKHLRVVG